MKWFENLRIAPKLLLVFGVVQLLMLMMGLASIRSMGRMNDASTDLASNWMPSVRAVMQLRTDVGELRRWQLAHMLTDVPKSLATYEERMAKTLADQRANAANYEKLISSPEERAIYEDFSRNWQLFLGEHEKVVALSRQNLKAEARAAAAGNSAKILGDANAALDKLVKLNVEGGQRAGETSAALYRDSRTLSIALLVLAALAGSALALWVARMVARPLGEAVEAARAVADGDLTRDLSVRSRDETGELMAALRDMTAKLQALVAQVRTGTDTIATAASQIAAGNQDLSARTEQQASALEETASSMEELTSTVRQNADNARQANQLAQSASGIAVRGGAVVGEVVGTMAAINEASRKIVDIISVIDGIAFQTNILALNAAVEAARAGEQGRGFAVVASEVRNLAQRSAAAAKDIKHLIDDSVGKVDAGSRLVNEAGSTMDEIVASITRVTDIMSEITAASTEQSAGIEQVNQAVVQMDQTTQQNAALVEESAAAAEAMQQQAAHLAQIVGVFRISAQAAGMIVPPPAPRRTAVVAASAPRAVQPAPKPAPRPVLAPAKAPAKAQPQEDQWEEF
ncbi:methyl-accepting chemotaxis protein [Pseudoduganella armeniaca]|uniref:Methyl-accepting chemotaxis protein n=1 Tax=Pseudoduganella armeniaca TaxID=2072590 RepID=A0A2R4CFT5_9BURK|nr:methyl-accepting chemotaxis protein [Pseudoduganella armeniaca]AVR98412.1 methyl-accepting chemotaxis protein [Pseudoduganella armeniaca]